MNTSTHKTAEPRFHLQFLKPRFWATWCYLLFLRIFMYFPRRWVMALGGFIGEQFLQRNQKRRRIAEINIRLCFPQYSESQRQQLLVEHFRQYGRGLLDLALSLWASSARIASLCHWPQRAWLGTMAQHNRIIIVAYHLTTLDLSGSVLARHHPCVAFMKRDRNPLLNWQLWKGRSHLNTNNITILMRDQGLRPLLRLIRSKHVCVFVPDEDFGENQNTVFVPFFGVQASTLTVVSRLAKLSGALVLPSAARLHPKSGRYTFTVGKPLENFPSNDAKADAGKLNQAMENLIREAPEQYMWTFRWFKTRPHGKPSPYK